MGRAFLPTDAEDRRPASCSEEMRRTGLKKHRRAADTLISIITCAETRMSHPLSPAFEPKGNPSNPEAYVLSLISEGKLDAALDAITGLGDGAVYWPDFYNQAQRLMLAGHLDAAVQTAEAAVRLDPARPLAYEIVGTIRLRQARLSEAQACFQAALERDPRSPSAHFGRGRVLRQQGKRRRALEELVAAVESDPRAEWIPELQRAMRRGEPRNARRGRAAKRDSDDALLRRAERAISRARSAPSQAHVLPTISLCMIVRDEQDSLPRCLASARSVADEIIIVDTGSLDDTVTIGQKSGAAVHHFAWCDDFAAARNESLRYATCDWIMVLDADDELGNAAGLKEYLAGTEGVNVCSMRTRIPHAGKTGETVIEHPRLFRGNLGFHYRAPVHEQLCDADGNPAVAGAALDVAVYHHGYLEHEAEQKKRGERNLRILRTWVARSPEDAWAQFCLGQAHYTEHDMERAMPALTLALELAAADRAYRPKAYAYLASAQSARDRHDQAEETCRTALREFPDQPELLFCLGYALERQGQIGEAVAAYEAATQGRFGPMLAHHDFTCRDLKPLARLAEIHSSQGRSEEAEHCLDQIERIRGRVPALADMRERIESARRVRERAAITGDAVAEARAAVAADPNDAATLVRLAAALLGSGNSAEAEEHAEAALRSDPTCADALNLKGILLCSSGQFPAAAEHFQRAAAVRPDYADALCNLGVARLRTDDVAGAERAFREAAEAEPSCYAAHLALAEIADSLSDTHGAIANYERAIAADPTEPAAWLGLARCCVRSGAYDAAAQCYAQAIELGARTPDVAAEIERFRARLAGARHTAAAAATSPLAPAA